MLAYMRYEQGLKFQNIIFENEEVAKAWLKKNKIENPDCYKLVEIKYITEEDLKSFQ